MTYLNQLLSLSNQNKYSVWYYNIISKAIARASSKKQAVSIIGPTERHHILPKSFHLGGEKDSLNYAFLSTREHFIVHKLLMRMFTNTKFSRKMRYGFVCFTMNKSGKRILKSRDYALAKDEFKKLNSMSRPWCIGRESPFKGKSHTKEIKNQISASRKGQKTSRIYTELSSETKSKLSKSKKGKSSTQIYTKERKTASSKQCYDTGFNKIISGTIWINDGANNKRIKPEQFENYSGFILGRLIKNHTSES